MKTPDAIIMLQRAQAAAGARGDQLELVIRVHYPGTIGASPCVPIDSISPGIDWDQGKLFIQPQSRLTTLTRDEVDDITRSVRTGQSWHAYQRWKAHQEQVQALRARIAELERGQAK